MVTVVIPNYNHSKYLKQRIESILEQDYNEFEIIILDDNSTDNSVEIIESFRNESKIKDIIVNRDNSGSVFRQWRKAFEIAKGNYLWIAESDDYASKDFLSKTIPIMEKNPNIGILYTNSYVVKNEKIVSDFSTIRNKNYQTQLWSESFYMSGTEFLKKFMSGGCAINNASCTVMKSCLFNDWSYLENFKYHGDWAVYNKILEKSDIYYFNEPLSYYRDHEKNISKQSIKNFSTHIEHFKIYNSYYQTLNSKLEKSLFIKKISYSVLPILIVSPNRLMLYNTFSKINKDLLNKLLYNLPQVFLYLIKNKILY